MHVSSPASSLRGLLAALRPRPVVFSSPCPASECFRRLAAVTTRRGFTSWHLDPQTAGRPDPKLRGSLGASQISVARWKDAAGRGTFAPWLYARLQADPSGGTTLTGSIGLHPLVRALIPVFAVVGVLIALGGLAGGVALLVSGHIRGSLPDVLIPLFLGVFMVGLNLAGLRSLERNLPRLIEEINAILGSGSAPG